MTTKHRPDPRRRTVSPRVRSILLAAALVAPAAASAQSPDPATYPTHPIRFVVPFAAGGGTDVIVRLVARHLAEAWKVNVIVDNRVGAGGVVGSQYLSRQSNDGRHFLAVASAFGVRAAIDPTVPYEVSKDFSGVGMMARSPSFMVVSTSHGFRTLADLIAYAKAQPKGILYGSAGVGSTAHLHAAATAHLAGFRAEHVAFRGTPEAVNDALTARVLYAFAPGPNAIPLAKQGKLQILVTTSPAGARFMPGVPSLAEAGVKGYEGDDWFGVYAPAGTPLPIRERVAAEMARVLALPEVRERLNSLGAEPTPSGAMAFETFSREYIAGARKLAQAIGIKPE